MEFISYVKNYRHGDDVNSEIVTDMIILCTIYIYIYIHLGFLMLVYISF